MKEIAEKTFIENDYLGVTLGAALEAEQLTYIDAPLLNENLRTWRNSMVGKKKPEQLLVLSDSHPDRSIGSRFPECPIVAQELVFRIYQNRPVTFHAEEEKIGADYEKIRNMAGFRWVIPEIVFSDSMDLKIHERVITVEYHPGPSIGCTWTLLKDVKCVFIGDTVLTDHVPFLADADLLRWEESLALLESPAFDGYQIVSGRSGLITRADVARMKEFVVHLRSLLDEGAFGSTADLLKASDYEKYFSLNKKIKNDAVERLTYGLKKLTSKSN